MSKILSFTSKIVWSIDKVDLGGGGGGGGGGGVLGQS
jgi:hypothetical protein